MGKKEGDGERLIYLQFKHSSWTARKLGTKVAADAFAAMLQESLPHKDLKKKNIVVHGKHDVGIYLANDVSAYEQSPVMAKAQPTPKLEVAPGFKLHGFLTSLCPKSFNENVLDEYLAAGTMLYQERLSMGDKRGAQRVRWAMRVWLLRAVFGGFITGAFLLITQFRKSPD
jgi:hypothetical protein